MFLLELLGRSFWLSALGGAAAVAIGGTAFTAANTVAPSTAGSGAEAISGYTITNIDYTLNASNPQNLDAVSFSYSGVATPATARVSHNNGTTWYNCTAGISGAATGTVTCNSGSTPAFSGIAVSSATNLVVVMTD